MQQMDKSSEAQAWATGKRAKRRSRLSSAELRDKVLDTALEMLQETGLTVSLAHLKMEELIRIADVPRSSVYREWETAEEFYVALMERMLEPAEDQGVAFDEETIRIALAVIEEHRDELGTVDGRRRVLMEAIRQGVARNFEAVSRALAWRTFTTLNSTLPALEEEHRERIQAALVAADEHFINRMAAFYESVISYFGLQFKPGFDVYKFTATASSVVEGLIGRSFVNPTLVNTPVSGPGIKGESAPWHLAAVGWLGILDAMTEPTPEHGEPGDE
ncbi:TetR/AcrR family transcriptional regulator [Rhodococcus sp. WAY2]|uniref:TetR/AcrR family transcriptional regulator n=1 Tax=Rhodococcus sp. WAY2 TaxID=2663121 RepID=UPI00135800D0|nr:hypothetical protein [Rhodococcus sp. WAY2]